MRICPTCHHFNNRRLISGRANRIVHQECHAFAQDVAVYTACSLNNFLNACTQTGAVASLPMPKFIPMRRLIFSLIGLIYGKPQT